MAVCGQPLSPNRAFRTRGKPCAGEGVVNLARRGGGGKPCAGHLARGDSSPSLHCYTNTQLLQRISLTAIQILMFLQ